MPKENVFEAALIYFQRSWPGPIGGVPLQLREAFYAGAAWGATQDVAALKMLRDIKSALRDSGIEQIADEP